MKSLKFIAMACVVSLAFGCNKDKEAKPAEKADNAKGSEEVAKKDHELPKHIKKSTSYWTRDYFHKVYKK